MRVIEIPDYTADYLDPAKRSIANAIQIHFQDGTTSEKVTVEYPLGHRRRRLEGIPLIFEKLRDNLSTHYPEQQVDQLVQLFQSPEKLKSLPVHALMSIFAK